MYLIVKYVETFPKSQVQDYYHSFALQLLINAVS